MNWRSATTTKVIGGLSLALVAGAGWLVALSPQAGELSEVRTQIESTRDQNDNLRGQLAKLNAQAAKLDGTRRTARALAERFPPTADQPALFKAVTGAAALAGIPADDVTELTPAAPVAGSAGQSGNAKLPGQGGAGELASQTVAISVEGSYEETQKLLENLEEIPRAYLVSGLTLGTGAEAGTFTATITGQMFVMPAAPDPTSAPRR